MKTFAPGHTGKDAPGRQARPQDEARSVLQDDRDDRGATRQLAQHQRMADASPRTLQLREITELASAGRNQTGMPDRLKAGIEVLSGVDMSTVRVHRDSGKPAQLNAHAYAQGNEIHLAPGQEAHLPHEAWHLAQQAQGRVAPTLQVGGMQVNDDRNLEAEADAMGARAARFDAMAAPAVADSAPRLNGAGPLQRFQIEDMATGEVLVPMTEAEFEARVFAGLHRRVQRFIEHMHPDAIAQLRAMGASMQLDFAALTVDQQLVLLHRLNAQSGHAMLDGVPDDVADHPLEPAAPPALAGRAVPQIAYVAAHEQALPMPVPVPVSVLAPVADTEAPAAKASSAPQAALKPPAPVVAAKNARRGRNRGPVPAAAPLSAEEFAAREAEARRNAASLIEDEEAAAKSKPKGNKPAPKKKSDAQKAHEKREAERRKNAAAKDAERQGAQAGTAASAALPVPASAPAEPLAALHFAFKVGTDAQLASDAPYQRLLAWAGASAQNVVSLFEGRIISPPNVDALITLYDLKFRPHLPFVDLAGWFTALHGDIRVDDLEALYAKTGRHAATVRALLLAAQNADRARRVLNYLGDAGIFYLAGKPDAEIAAAVASCDTDRKEDGHSVRSHGPQVTTVQHDHRLATGHAPDGRVGAVPPLSSSFNSFVGWRDAANAAVNAQPDINLRPPGMNTLTMVLNRHHAGTGRALVAGAPAATGHLNRVLTKFVVAEGEYKMVQHFPTRQASSAPSWS